MNFDKKLKREILESIMQELQGKIEEISENEELSEEEKIKVAYQELVPPYRIFGSLEEQPTNRENLKELVRKKVNSIYNQRINCGGYALKVDTCLFPGGKEGVTYKECLERSVTDILDIFPFVRLLGDTELEEDEYLVEYRVGKGHHFIRIENDGSVSDKNGSDSPRNLNNIIGNKEKVWLSLKDCPSAVFAVKKEHDIHAKPSYCVGEGQNFEETTLDNLNNGNSEFEYHNHKYTIVENQDGDKTIFCDAGPVAEIIADDSGIIVVQREEKRDYISNTKSKTYDKYMEQIISEKKNKYEEQPISIDIEEDFELEL